MKIILVKDWNLVDFAPWQHTEWNLRLCIDTKAQLP